MSSKDNEFSGLPFSELETKLSPLRSLQGVLRVRPFPGQCRAYGFHNVGLLCPPGTLVRIPCLKQMDFTTWVSSFLLGLWSGFRCLKSLRFRPAQSFLCPSFITGPWFAQVHSNPGVKAELLCFSARRRALQQRRAPQVMLTGLGRSKHERQGGRGGEDIGPLAGRRCLSDPARVAGWSSGIGAPKPFLIFLKKLDIQNFMWNFQTSKHCVS